MEDLISSPAFVFIEDQVACGAIPAAAADLLRSKFVELYRTTHNAIEREKDLLSKARDLRASVRDEQIALEKARIRKEQMEALNEETEAQRRKLAAAFSEVEAKERDHQQDLNELRMREVELTDDVAALRKENEALVAPQLQALMDEIGEARGDAQRASLQIEALSTSKVDLHHQLGELEAQVAAAKTTSNALKMELMRVKGEPERASKAVESIRRALQEIASETARTTAMIAARDAEISDQLAAKESMRGVRQEVDAKLSRYRIDIEHREKEITAVEKTLRAERTQYKELLEQRIDLQTEEAAATASVRTAEGEKDGLTTGYERGKRELKRKTDAANDAVAAVPTMQSQMMERQLDFQHLQSEGKDLETQLTAMKREMDVLLAQFMKTEGVEKRFREELADLIESCTALEAEKDIWHKEELLCHKQLSALKAQRDIKSRDLAKMVASRKTTVEHSKMKELQLLDLTKQLADINAKLRQFAAMYEVVKNERNTFANNIQAASQSIAEMRERIKILHNEVDILQNESNAKDKALSKERQAHAVAAVQRDALRAETNKCSLVYREKQALVEGQIMSIDKLNAIINRLEREMLSLKKQYEAAVETRNYTGIQLIDRNDELCILYEKANIHEKTLGDGERELRTVTEEVRSLKICIADLERCLHLARSKYPDTPMWAEKILELQKQLVLSRQVTEKLCQDLETPSSSDRWVELGGEDPDPEKLKLRVVQLESRVNAAREELLEKDLILEEITGLTSRLQAAAKEALEGGSGAETPGVNLAKTANELQSKIKDVNKKLMAIVSELSMYQATAIKLSGECDAAQAALDRADEAAAAGLPPTMAAEHKWQSMERAMTLPASAGAQKLDSAVVDGPRTAAEPRPNAYIPEGIGLPKPYGEFPPFKPAQPGAIMRFFRNPEVPEIEL